jgi:hypothetical protein
MPISGKPTKVFVRVSARCALMTPANWGLSLNVCLIDEVDLIVLRDGKRRFERMHWGHHCVRSQQVEEGIEARKKPSRTAAD